MKLSKTQWNLFLLCNLFFFIICLNACSSMSVFGFMGIKDEVDEELPVVKTFRALPDVTSIGFEWNTPENTSLIDGYLIYRKNKNGEFVKISFVKNAFSTHYYDEKLQPQTEYEYAIASVGKDSKVSKKSTTLKVKTSFIDPVSFVYASQNYAQKVKIYWSPSPNPVVKNYLIEKKDEKSEKFITIGSTSNRMLVEFFDNELANGAEYSYRIVAQSYDGTKSVPSQVVVGKTRSAPNAIGGITTTNDKPKTIWIEWQPSDNKAIVGYNVWASDREDGMYSKLAFVRGTSYIDKIDEDGAVRYYKVSVVDEYKLESSLQELGVSGQTLVPPPTPNLTQGLIQNRLASIAWEKVDDKRVVSYVIYRQGSRYDASSRFSGITNTEFIDNSLQDGISYTYYVVSVDRFGIESLPSKKVTLKTDSQNETKQTPQQSDTTNTTNEAK